MSIYRFLLLFGLPLVVGCATPSEEKESPYVGEQDRAIKALSAEEVEGYLAGEGMGYAKAAELNRYPGPKHVLGLADDLGLTEDQREETEEVFERMQAEAIRLGTQVVAREGALDALFARQEATPALLRPLVRELGELQGDLRLAHLEAHLAMKDILTEEQTDRYDQLRGYDAGAPPGQQHPMDKHHH